MVTLRYNLQDIGSSFKPKTPLGRQLWSIRKRIVASGETLLEILDDQSREFVSSPFVELEVLPKAIYNKKRILKLPRPLLAPMAPAY